MLRVRFGGWQEWQGSATRFGTDVRWRLIVARVREGGPGRSSTNFRAESFANDLTVDEQGPLSMWCSITALLALALVALPVHADRNAERMFRQWADERLAILSKDGNATERAKAAAYLGSFDYPEVIAALTVALEDPDARVRAAAAGALWKTGKAAEPARATLLKALDDPVPSVVIRAAGALQTLGVTQATLVPARKHVFDAPGVSNTDRYMAARGLIGQVPSLPLLAPILEFLERSAVPRKASGHSMAERESFEGAASALERLARTQDRSLIAPLMEAMRSSRNIQSALLKALALFQPKPDGWTDIVVGYLDSPDPRVRHTALALLGKQTTEKDVLAWAPKAAALLRDPDDLVRSEALWSLGRAGGLAAKQVDAVVAMLGDPDGSMRRRAVVTLGKMGERTQAVTAVAKANVDQRARPMLVALMEQDPDAEVRREAKRALAKLGRGAPSGDAAAPGPGSAAGAAEPSAEAAGVALLRERKITMDTGSYFQALAATDPTLVRAFLDAGMSPVAPVAGSGPPLVVMFQVSDACAPGVRPTKPETKVVLKLLLERGADANRGDANGLSPLMAASMKGCDREVMKTLIVAGAKVGATNRAGLSAFDMGMFSGHDGLEELIAAGYRLPPEKAKAYQRAFAGKPAVLALILKATR